MSFNRLSTDIDKHIGERLKLRRNSLGVSQEKLAQELGISFQQIQKYEKGKNRIASGRLFEISKILCVNIGYFFEGFDSKIESALPCSANDAYPLLRKYYSIKDQQTRESILSLIDSVSNS